MTIIIILYKSAMFLNVIVNDEEALRPKIENTVARRHQQR